MEIRKVVVIGSGTMGSGIAAHLCNANVPVTLLDLTTEISEKARERIKQSRPPLLIDKAKINNIDEAKALEGKELGVSDWVVVDQGKIEKFAIATGDDQWIHLDQNRAKKELPDGKTIAHGYLTLSLVPALTRNFIEVKGLKQMINFGCNKVRFYSVVNEGDRVRARGTLMEAKQRGSMIQLLSKITVEVENKPKPACVVEMLVFLVMK